MFEHFTFGAVSQARPDEEPTASPTDMSFSQAPSSTSSYPFPPSNDLEDLNDIVHQFSKQSLHRDQRLCSFAAWREATRRPLEVDTDCETTNYSPASPSARSQASNPTAPLSASSCRRLQRQFNTQLQLSTSHIRSLNSLVEEMISTSTQCRLQSPISHPSTSSPIKQTLEVDPASPSDPVQDSAPHFPPDEGFCDADSSCEDDAEMTLRRASAPSGIRKHGGHGGLRWSRSADIFSARGRAKVRCEPRMRKRAAGIVVK